MKTKPNRVALVTCDALPELYAEEAQLPKLLEARGLTAVPVSWTNPEINWGRFELIVLRSTWDYFERFPEFLVWLDRIEKLGGRMWNPPALVRWNADKRYLRELEGRGIRIVPTAFCEARSTASLEAIVLDRGWPEVVIKPAVSGGAWRTHRVKAGEAPNYQTQLEELLATTGVLVQPFVREIQTEGEWSLFFFGGAFSHAVLKVPAADEYRIQPQFGGTAVAKSPEPWMIEQARQVLAALPFPPAYARIDGVRRDRELLLMEAELIEPYLFLGAVPEAMPAYLDLIERLARR